MKRFFQRYLPDHQVLRTHKNLRFLGDLLHDPRLWHFGRRSTVRGLAVGAFCAFVPIPWQMLLAAAVAAWLRCNLPVAVAMVWITNPLTISPLAYGAYRFGAWILRDPPLDWAFEFSLDGLLQRAGDIGLPFLVGTLAIAVLFSIVTFGVAHLFWRWHIITKFRRRRRRMVTCSP